MKNSHIQSDRGRHGESKMKVVNSHFLIFAMLSSFFWRRVTSDTYLFDLWLLPGVAGNRTQQIGQDELACRILKEDFIVVNPMEVQWEFC